MTKLSRAYNALKADVMGRTGNEAPDAEKEQAFLDVQEAMSLVTSERAGLHQIGLGFAVMASTREELEENVEMVHSTATRSQVSLRRAFGHQRQAMSFFVPQKVEAAIREEYRNTMSPGLACLTPFGYEVRKDIRGPFVAVNVSTGSPFFLSKFDLSAYNEIDLGRTGSG